jgi:hypothetical protein
MSIGGHAPEAPFDAWAHKQFRAWQTTGVGLETIFGVAIGHIEFDLGDSGLTYNICEALGIHADNDPKQVLEFIALYLDLGHTSASAFRKGGLLFIALLHNVFNAFSELAGTMMGRAVVNKHQRDEARVVKCSHVHLEPPRRLRPRPRFHLVLLWMAEPGE